MVTLFTENVERCLSFPAFTVIGLMGIALVGLLNQYWISIHIYIYYKLPKCVTLY